MDNIFTKDFWIKVWQEDKENQTYDVHRGFSSVDYWDKAAKNYNSNKKEKSSRRLEKTLDFFKKSDLLSSGMKVLDIGCGTGMLALELAKNGANVTAIDFSKGMLERFRKDVPKDLENRITILCEDWYEIDIQKKGWYKEFDLVIAFMSPGVASSESFFKMMDCSKKGCAIRGWAGKRTHPVLGALWEKIMDNPLEDKPQSILYKINLLFAMGYYPEITFDTVQWDQKITQKEELDNQMAFFKKVSKKTDNALEKIIKPYLACISEKGIIEREHQGVTATAVWKL